MFSGVELIVIVGVVLLLFGGAKLPGLASALGKSVRNFKMGLRGDDGIEVKKVDDGGPTQDSPKTDDG